MVPESHSGKDLEHVMRAIAGDPYKATPISHVSINRLRKRQPWAKNTIQTQKQAEKAIEGSKEETSRILREHFNIIVNPGFALIRNSEYQSQMLPKVSVTIDS